MKCLNFGSEEAPKWYFATTILINGEELEIIPAFTDYSLKHKNFEKDKVFKAIDKSKLLPTVFCFCDAKPFYAENVPLYDYVGNKIKNLPDNAPAVMVYLDKADNVNLLGLTDEPLQAELVECDSVSDAYRRVATTAYLSQCPSKDEWIGYAGIVTGDELFLNIRKFGIMYSMSGTAVQGYFGISTTVSLLQSKALAMSSSLFKEEYRTYAQAEQLMKATVQAFGVKAAKQTRYIKAINYCISQYDFDTVCNVLNSIEATEKLRIEAAKCEDKISWLKTIVIIYFTYIFKFNNILYFFLHNILRISCIYLYYLFEIYIYLSNFTVGSDPYCRTVHSYSRRHNTIHIINLFYSVIILPRKRLNNRKRKKLPRMSVPAKKHINT